jgi:pimeloyl-ACP methyl ester carboxylesterase
MTPVVYLHGFASGPGSSKAQFFRRKFAAAGVPMEIPRLDEGSFETLTISGQLAVIERAAAGKPVILMGSSLGGYLSALYAARHPSQVERMVLLAPAFQFPRRWQERYPPEDWKRRGSITVFHYGDKQERRLGYQFAEDAMQYEDEPAVSRPTLIIHGMRDEVVPADISRGYAAANPQVKLVLLESGHELTDVLEPMWAQVSEFLSVPETIGRQSISLSVD